MLGYACQVKKLEKIKIVITELKEIPRRWATTFFTLNSRNTTQPPHKALIHNNLCTWVSSSKCDK